MPSHLPNAPATERNREPILAVLREHFADRHRVLEIGSGTGQHAIHFAAALPHLHWQPSDLRENHPAITGWIADAELRNISPPIQRYDAVFTANTLHIISWPQVQSLFANLPRLLAPDATIVVYGPFNVDGRFSAPSNAAFDASLRERDPASGIRDLEAVKALATQAGLRFEADIEMPANNCCLVWRTAAE